MADSKISALPASTTPLAGTEVLPIVQSSTTKKVAVSDLTAGRAVSALSVALSGATGNAVPYVNNSTKVLTTGSTFTYNGTNFIVGGNTVPDVGLNSYFTNGTVGIGQYLSSTVGYSGTWTNHPYAFAVNGSEVARFDTSGNLVPKTAAKGINFTANTPAAGMTSQLLNWYEEGTWTPTYSPTTGSFTTLTTSVLGATYVKIGRQVICKCLLRTTNVVLGTAAGALKITGLPFTAAANDFGGVINIGVSLGFATNNPTGGYVDGNTVLLYYRTTSNGESQASTVADLTTGASSNKNYIIATIMYEAA